MIAQTKKSHPGKKETQKREKVGSSESLARTKLPNNLNQKEIRALQTILKNGERVTILGVGNSLMNYSSLFNQLAREIKTRNHPLWLIKGKGIYSRQEIIRYLRESSKVIAIELSNGTKAKPEAFPSSASGKMPFPEVLHWSSMLGLPPEVVLKSGKLTEFSMEKLLAEIGLEP